MGAVGRSDMKKIKRATIVLPLIVVLLGVALPLLMEQDEGVRATDAESAEARVSGRTAAEWADLARSAAEQGRLNRALSYIKTAEAVEPGAQYAAELRGIRSERRKASEIDRNRLRLNGNDIDHVEFDESGAVVSAHRLVTVLPGESLWTLARDVAAARWGVPAADIPQDDRDVYRLWDTLTAMNGVRELEVGERVLMPLTPGELTALADTNGRDLERVASASEALSSGDIDGAARLRGEIEGTFAASTAACAALDGALESALAGRTAARELEREHALVEDAHEALASIPELPRVSRHAERLEALEGARAALAEAEALRPGEQYSDSAVLADGLLSEETRFAIRDDGSVVVRKSPGLTYTDAVRQAVEWVLERELLSSGRGFPYSDSKSPDELAWAAYLAEAARIAETDGADFTALLEAIDDEVEFRLPDPAVCFAD